MLNHARRSPVGKDRFATRYVLPENANGSTMRGDARLGERALPLRALLAALVALVLPASAYPLPPDCQVRSIDSVPAASASHPSFSPDGTRLTYNGEDGDGDYQLFVADADGTSPVNISRSDRHHVGPAWHPSGRFIAVNVEADRHPLTWGRTTFFARHLFDNGLWEALWVTTPDGSRWWKLVDVTTDREDGVFHIAFSPDGTKIAWGQLVHRAESPDYPWGAYRLKVADFVVTDGVPSLENVRDVTPPWGKLVEPGGFSNGRLVFGGNDPDSPPTTSPGIGDLEVWDLDLATGEARNLTHDDDWDEHPSYSPDGRRTAYLNVREINLMNSDGSGTERLTRFNDWLGGPMWRDAAREWPVIPTTTDWSPDGTKLAVSIQSTWHYPKSWLTVLNFAGACGR